MNLYQIRNVLGQGKKLIDLPLRVTFYARVSTDHEEQLNSLNLKDNEIMFLVPGDFENVSNSLGALRLEVAKELEMIDETLFNFLWVVNWPLLEYDEEDNRYYAKHHPFTAPKNADDLGKAITLAEIVETYALLGLLISFLAYNGVVVG